MRPRGYSPRSPSDAAASRQRRRLGRRRADREGGVRALDDASPPSRAVSLAPRCPTRRSSRSASRPRRRPRRSRPRASPTTTDEQYKDQCKQEYDQLRDQVLSLLTSFEWIEGEAEEQGIKVTDAEVKKSFDQQKKQSFPKDADYQKFLKDSGQTEQDVMQRVKLDLLSNKIRDKVDQGQGQGLRRPDRGLLRQEQGALRAARAARPAGRPDQERGEGQGGQGGARERRVLEVRRQEVLDRRGLQGAGRQAARAGQGHAREGARRGRLQGREGRVVGPVKTQFGYYVFEVDKVPKASQQTLEQAKETIRQTLQSQNQQKALDKFVKDFQKKWKERTECREGYVTQQCKNAPKPTPTPTRRRDPAAADPAGAR